MPYDYESTHRQILLSAMKNFSEVGFRDASIRTICKDAGVTNGAFYAHFKSKDDLHLFLGSFKCHQVFAHHVLSKRTLLFSYPKIQP